MKSCNQNDFQTIYDHGVSVRDHLKQLLDFVLEDKPLKNEWHIPEWLTTYKEKIKEKLFDKDIIMEYALFHDVGKPRCLIIENGKRHFPNHANVSADYWLECGGDERVAKLIRMDMDIHLIKNDGVSEFAKRPQCFTLLLAGLAEVHSNAASFGGFDSTSFKIKYKQIRKRGNAICKEVFEK
jgi:putative nucleotidyltransferase with HDIG domain